VSNNYTSVIQMGLVEVVEYNVVTLSLCVVLPVSLC